MSVVITRALHREIQKDLQEAIDKVMKKHGLGCEPIATRFNSTTLRISKVDFHPAVEETATKKTTAAPAGVSATLAQGMKKYKLTRTTNMKGEKLVDYKASRPKYPFTFEGPRGGRWKLSALDAQVRFG